MQAETRLHRAHANAVALANAAADELLAEEAAEMAAAAAAAEPKRGKKSRSHGGKGKQNATAALHLTCHQLERCGHLCRASCIVFHGAAGDEHGGSR